MKNLFRVSVLLVMAFLATGCCGVEVKSNIGSSPLFRYGEQVWVVNGLKHNIEVVYQSWGKKQVKINLSPGQDGTITGLCDGDHLLARVYSYSGEVIGTTTARVRGRRDSQVWEIHRYNRLR
jgi:hypothetical protein